MSLLRNLSPFICLLLMVLQRGEADITFPTKLIELKNTVNDINNDEEEINISEIDGETDEEIEASKTDEETEASETVNPRCQRDKAAIEKKFYSVFQEMVSAVSDRNGDEDIITNADKKELVQYTHIAIKNRISGMLQKYLSTSDSNYFCFMAWQECSKHPHYLTHYYMYDMKIPVFTESNSEKPKLKEMIKTIPMLECSIFDNHVENFFFSIIGDTNKSIFLFKRDDNKLEATDVKLFAVINNPYNLPFFLFPLL